MTRKVPGTKVGIFNKIYCYFLILTDSDRFTEKLLKLCYYEDVDLI